MTSDRALLRVIVVSTVITIVLPKNVGLEQAGPQKENYEPDYSIYHNLSGIFSDLTEIINKYSKYIISNNEFFSKAGRPQMLIRITNLTSEVTISNKVKILLSFGEHAREFFPIESMFYFLKNLTRGLDSSEGSQSYVYSAWVVNSFDLYIVAITNPDGRYYIERTKNYCWRGTGSGIDLNRNFDWNFGGKGSSGNQGHEEYRGPHAFSEPETQVFLKLTESVPFDAFISFHSGIRHIYIPFSDSKSKEQHKLPKNIDEIIELAKQMSGSSPARPFKYDLAYKLLDYSADGTSFDYMAGAVKIPFSLAIELWEHEHHTGSSCFDEFNPRSEHLEAEVALVHPLYVELLSFLSASRTSNSEAGKLERMSALVRVKKDDSAHNEPQKDETLQPVHNPQEIVPSVSLESEVVCGFFALVAVVCVVLGARHIRQLMHKKRIISLKSLSSTFSLYKTS